MSPFFSTLKKKSFLRDNDLNKIKIKADLFQKVIKLYKESIVTKQLLKNTKILEGIRIRLIALNIDG